MRILNFLSLPFLPIFAQIDPDSFDPTLSCSSKTDMATFECCNNLAFYNCTIISANTGKMCNCNSNCALDNSCCNDQASVCSNFVNGPPSTSSTHRTFNSPAEILRGIFTQNGLLTFLPNIMSDILAHGCFCPLLDENTISRSSFGGLQPIDDLDAFCQAWHSDLACMRLNPMRCDYFSQVNAAMDIMTNFQCIST